MIVIQAHFVDILFYSLRLGRANNSNRRQHHELWISIPREAFTIMLSRLRPDVVQSSARESWNLVGFAGRL